MIIGAIEAGKRSGAKRAETSAHRAATVLNLHVAGLTKAEIARRLDVSPRTVFRALADVEDDRIRVEELIEDCGLDATDIHITLSRMHDADLSDIVVNPEAPIEEMQYKPLAQWPPIWRQGLAGKIRITPVTLPDGERTKGGDQTAYKIEIERESILKILELSAKLKMVDALAKTEGDTNINITVTAQQQRLDRAKTRLERVIEVKPEVSE